MGMNEHTRRRRGQTLVEYALILTVMIVITLLVALGTIGDSTTKPIGNMAGQMDNTPDEKSPSPAERP